MKQLVLYFITAILFVSCGNKKEKIAANNPTVWKGKEIELKESDSLVKGSSYLSVYPAIYNSSGKKTYALTVTVSIRNMNLSEPIYIEKADYYNTAGELIKTYFDKPISLKPLETIEIVIDENENKGGTGANFIFDWDVYINSSEPQFEAVMISTSGQQGLSFTTQGVRIK